MESLKTWRPCALVVLATLALSYESTGVRGEVDNVITKWHFVAQKVVRTLGVPSQIASRDFTLLHLSQYKALQYAYEKRNKFPDTAAAYAAHYVLSEIYPSQQSPIFDGEIAKQVTPLNLTVEEDKEVRKIGLKYARTLLKKRVSDGSQKWANFQPSPPGGPVGKYQFTPNQTYALYPQLATTRPFVIKSSAHYDTEGGPLRIPSSTYDADYRELATIGNANSSLQTKFDKQTARFWEAGSNTSTINGYLFNVTLAIVGNKLSVNETAKLFAKITVAEYDSSIAGWYQKYKYLFWRPITALRQGDPTHKPILFTPYIATPPHPEYPSTHSVAAGSWGEVLAKYLGIPISQKTPYGSFTAATEGYFLPNRTFDTIGAVAEQVAISRIDGGIHFRKSTVDGLTVGYQVGDYIWKHFEEVFGGL